MVAAGERNGSTVSSPDFESEGAGSRSRGSSNPLLPPPSLGGDMISTIFISAGEGTFLTFFVTSQHENTLSRVEVGSSHTPNSGKFDQLIQSSAAGSSQGGYMLTAGSNSLFTLLSASTT